MTQLTYPRILDMPYCRIDGTDCLYWATSSESQCSRECAEFGCQAMARKAAAKKPQSPV